MKFRDLEVGDRFIVTSSVHDKSMLGSKVLLYIKMTTTVIVLEAPEPITAKINALVSCTGLHSYHEDESEVTKIW